MSEINPGVAYGATATTGDDGWTLIMVRELRHRPERVWTALVDPVEIDQWAPFAASAPLDATGETTLTMIDGDTKVDLPAFIRVADEPRLLEYSWGLDLLRWELEPIETGTRLTLRHHSPERGLEAMVAAGWHLCLMVCDQLIGGYAVGVIRGVEAKDHGWDGLRDGYAKLFSQLNRSDPGDVPVSGGA
ncbi:SRPBCC domain-containing protein [Actinoplanes sp. NPDC049265]|uniref:SRPBCC domain-containing protein n=1 Tax=Actinoplanes sp. NPDC049265 TaxID=3363902 RepID=UPI00371E2E68